MNWHRARVISLIVVGVFWPVDSFAEEPVSAAEKEFVQGLELFDAGNDEAALEHFRAAFALDPTPKIKANIIRCLVNLHRDVEVIAEYDALVAKQEIELPLKLRAKFESYLLEIGASMGFGLVYLETSHSGRMFLDGKPLPDSALRIPRRVPAGKHILRLEAPGMAPAELTVDVRSGERNRFRITARRPYEIDARLGMSGGGTTLWDELVPADRCSVYCFPGLSVLAGARLSLPITGPFFGEMSASYLHAQTNIHPMGPGIDVTSRFSLHALVANVGVGMDITRGSFRFQWRIGGGFIAGQHWETPVDRQLSSSENPPVFRSVLESRIGLSIRHRRTWFGVGVEGWSTLTSAPTYDVPVIEGTTQNISLLGPGEARTRPLGFVVLVSPEVSVGWEF